MTQVYNYLFGRNPRVAIQPVDLGKTNGVFVFFCFFFPNSLSRRGLFIGEKKTRKKTKKKQQKKKKEIECVFIDKTTTSIL